ncbi:type IV pilus secretin PilQ [Acinetobacter chengduensis]|jgi:type IV pilus assembly protein PilQ|uniref:Type IV pilus secretin PilQ n=2 Tax=Moraxellaceae TaxID=468 RepID=A0ABX9TWW7_9GAMM|nr:MULTISPECIES: type IV pilus secretin PilQ family protein [Acinetobacter]MBI1451866.1 type IV pilus secretin PilQ family protein [Acinetobacter sp. FL51]RKG44200.1 type IV pilus secretin PilQ [Acinetobacter sp. WCHAc060007]RLL21534.1 type IV pilus secretin PilQ [Acinetobacter chengduensis]
MKNSMQDFIFGDGNTMNRMFRQFSMGAVAMAVMQAASAGVAVTNVVPMQIPGQGTEIRVMFNGLPPQPQAYQLEQPSRLILDFDKAQQNLKQSSIPVATNEASSVDISSDAQRARLTVNLADAGAFTTRVEGNTFILKINVANTSASTPVAVQKQAQGISDIGFKRGSAGEGLVVIDLLGSNTPVDVQQQGSKIVVRTLGNKVPAHLARRLNVNDFATPVATVDAQNDRGSGLITIESSGSYEYMAYQTDNRLTISLKRPEDKNPARAKASNHYTGKKISLDFQDIEVRRVLQLLADFTDINMVAADSVNGNITLRLKDVPWDQALDIVLKTKNLDKRRNGNVIWIAPVAELIKAEEDEAKAIEQSVKLAPIQTEYLKLSYAKVADIEKLITQSKTNNTGGANNGSNASDALLSSRGSISVDARTNTLIVNDTANNIDKIRKMVDLLDVEVKQVMVEARIVTAQTEFSRELGVSWGLQRNNPSLSAGANGSNVWGGDYSPKFDLGVDLATGTAGTFNFGLLKISDFMLDLQLTALQSDGHGEVLSAPKVMTGDKQKASILRGDQIPYQSWSAEGGTTTSFVDANLKLEVTPSITPDGKVQMDLKIEKDTIGELTSAGYLINTNKLETNVLVGDGETVVLGGIFDDIKRNQYQKVPFLGDLPFVGVLFKNNVKTNAQTELLIFVTPRIVNDSVSRNH